MALECGRAFEPCLLCSLEDLAPATWCQGHKGGVIYLLFTLSLVPKLLGLHSDQRCRLWPCCEDVRLLLMDRTLGSVTET